MTAREPLDGDVCTTREAAEALGVSLRTIQLWVDGGVLEAWKTAGGHRRVSIESVRRVKNGHYPLPASPRDTEQRQETLLAYQPILDQQQKLFGYELLYRKGDDQHADIADPLAATTRVIATTFGELGILGAMGDSMCFINVDKQLLLDDILLTLAPDRVVLEISAAAALPDAAVKRCRFLKREGYRLLLDDFRPAAHLDRVLPEVSFVKVDCRESATLPADFADRLPAHVSLVAGRVETDDAYQHARRAGARYFQGFYFANPNVVRGAKVPPQRAAILDVLAMVISEASLADIERRLKIEPAICYSLLRLANSAALRTGRRIEKLQEAMLLLGRKNLQRWLQVLLFAHEENPARYPNPLMLSAAFRGRLLEYLALLVQGNAPSFHEKAFMVGILSYIEALLRVPLADALHNLHLSEDVEAALLRREGILGELLSLAEALDDGDLAGLEHKAAALGMAHEQLRSGLFESMRFSSVLAHA